MTAILFRRKVTNASRGHRKKPRTSSVWERSPAGARRQKLKVFLSYSRAFDGEMADKVKDYLDDYFVVVDSNLLPKKGSRDFLWGKMTKAIRDSDVLLVVASRGTASTSVVGEMAYAKSEGKPVAVVSPRIPDYLEKLADAHYTSASDLEEELESKVAVAQ